MDIKTTQDISDVLKMQQLFFDSGKLQSLTTKKEKLKSLLQAIEQHEDVIYTALHKDFRKPNFETYATEILFIKKELKLTIKNLSKWSKLKSIRPSLLNFPSCDYIYPQPYGRVLIISPWNYPFQLALSPLIGAVAAGNTVVLKPSEHAPHTSSLLQKIISEVFESHHVCCVEGDAEVAKELLSHRWDYIFFTGSSNVGKIIATVAAKNLTPTTLELGGKNPCIVHKDANIKLSAKRIAWGKFVNAGQTCIAPDYLLVHSKIKDTLVKELQNEITRFYGRNPQQSDDFARIINTTHFDRLQSLLEKQTVLIGGETNADDLYIAPTVIDAPMLDSAVMQDEIFGPILPILSYVNEDEIDNIISRYEKPLAFYVFSSSNRFSQKLLRSHSFGGGAVNDVMVQFVNGKLPFGGIGYSGLGAYHGKHTFDTFLHQKAVTKRGTWLDVPLRYAPYHGKLKWLKRLF